MASGFLDLSSSGSEGMGVDYDSSDDDDLAIKNGNNCNSNFQLGCFVITDSFSNG